MDNYKLIKKAITIVIEMKYLLKFHPELMHYDKIRELEILAKEWSDLFEKEVSHG